MVGSVEALLDPDAVKMFEKFKIFTKAELASRAEILYETYSKSINIEAHTMMDMMGKQIMPAAMRYAGMLAKDAREVAEAGADASVLTGSLKKGTALITEMQAAYEKLKEDTKKAAAIGNNKEQAVFYRDVVCADMAALRAPADALEMMVDKEVWPIPTYGDLLFEV